VAVATNIVRIDISALAWLEIEDDAGHVWHYHHWSAAEPCQIHVIVHRVGKQFANPSLVLDGQGNAFLRRDGPGLPQSALVRVPEEIGITRLSGPQSFVRTKRIK
jgi:hypothetical protein